MTSSLVESSIRPASPDGAPDAIERAFVRVPAGLVHYRSSGAGHAGTGTPAYLAHSGPGSSAGLVPLIETLGRSRRVVAPDMLGNGDSSAPSAASPVIDDYVDCVVEVLDALGLERVDFYGQHSGAHIGCELAIRHPRRVRRLVLDGIALFDDAERASLARRYAPAVDPDAFGGHLAWAWHFVEGLTMHFPYYERDPAHRLHAVAVPPPAARQALVVELLKALPTYHLAYRAMFAHRPATRLPEVAHETLVMAVDGDPLARFAAAAAALVPRSAQASVTRERRADALLRFFDAPEAVA